MVEENFKCLSPCAFASHLHSEGPRELNQESRLSEVHSIFSWLISSPVTAKHGSYVLSTVIQNLEYGVIAPYICGIWKDLCAAGRKPIRKFCQVFLDKHVAFHSQT
jgi:hypothetical protein